MSQAVPLHGVAEVPERVSTTLPAAISAGDGVYTGLSMPLLLKVPEPEVLQVRVAKPLAEAPLILKVLPSQLAASGPAFTVTSCRIFSCI
ncbi:hypothetical protein DSECCO2_656810 [anaerobic digester metagenome]